MQLDRGPLGTVERSNVAVALLRGATGQARRCTNVGLICVLRTRLTRTPRNRIECPDRTLQARVHAILLTAAPGQARVARSRMRHQVLIFRAVWEHQTLQIAHGGRVECFGLQHTGANPYSRHATGRVVRAAVGPDCRRHAGTRRPRRATVPQNGGACRSLEALRLCLLDGEARAVGLGITDGIANREAGLCHRKSPRVVLWGDRCVYTHRHHQNVPQPNEHYQSCVLVQGR